MRSLLLSPDGRLPAGLDEPRLRRLLDVLNPPGEETRLVGGAVRDALLGRPLSDVDLATTMLPQAVIARTKAARMRSIPTGIAHGTVTVMVEARSFEVTTLREDIETDGRHATVRFGRDFDADARRRDFTMNALSAGADGRVFDPVGGTDDLAAGRVRFIGDAATRIREDYLRILRFFRFHATYGSGDLDPAGLAAVIENRDGLGRLSRERVRAEFFKILAAPGADRCPSRHGPGRHIEADPGPRRGPRPRGPRPRLRSGARPGAAAGRLGAPPASRSQRNCATGSGCRTPNGTGCTPHGGLSADLAGRKEAPDRAELRRLLFDHGPQASADALRLFGAGLSGADPAPWIAAATALAEIKPPEPPFSGADLLARGLKGPALGVALGAARDAWAKAGFPDDPAAIGAMLDRAVLEQGV